MRGNTTAHRQKTVAVPLAITVLEVRRAPRAADPPTHAIDANVNDPGIDAARGSNLRLARARPARRVGKLLVFLPIGGADQRPGGVRASSAARPGASAITRSSSPTRTRRRSPRAAGRMRQRAGAAADRAAELRDQRAHGDPRRARRLDRRQRRSRQQHREPAQQGAAHLARPPTPARAGRSSSTPAADAPKWSQTVIAGASLGAGQAALIAAQHPVHRVALFAGWTDAKHGWVDARSDAIGPVLRADPRARRLLRAHVLRVRRLGLAADLPADRSCDRAGREPPAAVRHAATRVQPRADPTAPPSSTTRTTPAPPATARSPGGRRHARRRRSSTPGAPRSATATPTATSTRSTTARWSPTPTRPTATATGSATPAGRRSRRARSAARCRRRSRSRSGRRPRSARSPRASPAATRRPRPPPSSPPPATPR